MLKVILADGTVIENCTESTTANEIFVLRDTYEAAAAVRDLFTNENTKIIKVQDSDGQIISVNVDLILIEGARLIEEKERGIICVITTRFKTEMEKMQDQIAELQEVIIEG